MKNRTQTVVYDISAKTRKICECRTGHRVLCTRSGQKSKTEINRMIYLYIFRTGIMSTRPNRAVQTRDGLGVPYTIPSSIWRSPEEPRNESVKLKVSNDDMRRLRKA